MSYRVTVCASPPRVHLKTLLNAHDYYGQESPISTFIKNCKYSILIYAPGKSMKYVQFKFLQRKKKDSFHCKIKIN